MPREDGQLRCGGRAVGAEDREGDTAVLRDPDTGFSSLLGPEREREEFRIGLSLFI